MFGGRGGAAALASGPAVWVQVFYSGAGARAEKNKKRGASTWARTRDLSVNSRALCQLSHGGISTKMHPAGFEPAPSNEDYDLNVAC